MDCAIAALKMDREKYSKIEHLIDDTNSKRYVDKIRNVVKQLKGERPLPEGRTKCVDCGGIANKGKRYCRKQSCIEERKKHNMKL